MKTPAITKHTKVVVFDSGVEGALNKNNLLFDRKNIKDRHGLAGCYLYEECLRRGIQLVTPDIYFNMEQKPRAILLRNTTHTDNSDILIQMGVHPAVLLVTENPLYACEFFFNLKKQTALYDHSFFSSGARDAVSPRTIFHSWVPPQMYSSETQLHSRFDKKKYLTMISGNARIHPLRRYYVHFWQFFRPLPTLVDRELYVDRLKAIQYFSEDSAFDLYGRGWDQAVRYTFGRYNKSVRKAYRGEVDDKFITLKNYKFSICFENAIFGGWITEKIIDSLFAGCVPVYWGAPDVTNYIPAEAFIDFRKFQNFDGLNAYLKNMDAKTYQGYIDAINHFIHSRYRELSHEKRIGSLVDVLESYF